MTERQDHLRIRIPEKGELTLSMPDGVLRALRDKRFPSNAEVWDTARSAWVPLAGHPGIVSLLQSISTHTVQSDHPPRKAAPRSSKITQPTFAAAVQARKVAASPPPVADPDAPIDLIDLELPSSAELIGESASNAPALMPTPDLALVPDALPLMRVEPGHHEVPEHGADSPSGSEGTAGSKTMPSPASLVPGPDTGVTENRDPAYPLEAPARGKKKSPAPGPVAPAGPRVSRLTIVAPVLLLLAAGGYVLWTHPHLIPFSDSSSPGVSPIVDTLGSRPARDSTGGLIEGRDPLAAVPDLPLQGVSGAGPEPDLETGLQLANAVVWIPAEDFGSAEALLLARRKVDAVANSLRAYRVDMNRLPDSTKATIDFRRRVEPFAEARRVDEVLSVVQAAVQLLDSLNGFFQINGHTIAFNRPSDAGQWRALIEKADSLLAAPVELDPHPAMRRAPRRVVVRLVESLPKLHGER